MMINNLFHKFIMSSLMYISIMIFFMQNLLIMWFLMEINNFLFICYLCMSMKNKKLIFLYYLIQIIASMLLILSLTYNNLFMIKTNSLMILLYLALMIKLGIPPFHLWMPLISTFMEWKIMFIFLTIQKIMPLYMISIIKPNDLILSYMILSSILIPTIKMMNSLNIKILLTYSSINQTSWMLLLIFLKNFFWLMYMFTYTLILFIISSFFSYFKFSINFMLNKNLSFNFNLMYLMLIINLASLPPFSFFLMKWFNMFIMIFNSNLHFIFILMMINSLILTYIYINLMTLTMFFHSIKFKFLNIKINNMNLLPLHMCMLTYLNFMFSLILIMI
uniref:NADH-ubiquinone oxidoreductase chain 2 n=1 Tax=Acropyga kinomurai TaxID=602213 RepID=A0A6G5NIX5_9HYME|nr:NADH dehydrogenase subunit 2 [Acropyga kinomurai]QBG38626.1 NADH dehydrogenase subunit 2 [Acropyga kinomurai]